MVLQLLSGAIKLTSIFALIFAIIVLATGIAPMGEINPAIGRISAGLFLLAVVIIANILNGIFVPGQAKLIGFGVVNLSGLFVYLTL